MRVDYWRDENWFVGRLRAAPDVFSQGETVKELEENIRDAYKLLKGRPLTLGLTARVRVCVKTAPPGR